MNFQSRRSRCKNAFRAWVPAKYGHRLMLALTGNRRMFSTGELFAVTYMLVSSFCLVYQLHSQSFVTVECRNSFIFCLKDEELKTSLSYVLTKSDISNRCNSQGSSSTFNLLVFLLICLETVIFLLVIFGHRSRTDSQDFLLNEKRLIRLTNSLVTIAGILIGILVVFPLMHYCADMGNSAQSGFFNKFLHSPARAVFSFVITLITTPLTSIFHGQFAIELRLDQVYPNFTCVDPIRDRTTDRYNCPLQPPWSQRGPQPSTCKKNFYCADECQIIFPRIIISSLAVIVASFMFSYRLLTLRHNTIERVRSTGGSSEHERSSTSVANETRSDKNTTKSSKRSNAVNYREMKDKSVGREQAAACDNAEQHSDHDRELRKSSRRSNSNQHGMNGVRFRDFKTNTKEFSENNTQWRLKAAEPSKKNGDRTRRPENGFVKRGSGRNRVQIEGPEEQDIYSSSEDFGEVILVEDESEYYMSGFRL